jgi:undecaprenyl phosphate-alpha-L-ara4FN deformylase
MIPVGLRIDVDTLRGTRAGVPNLLETLAENGIRASFFVSVGPDNMGRHLRRLARPAFLVKMLRTRAVSLYGWDILLRGTTGPGPVIGRECPEPIRDAAEAGHEVGLHAWDHHRWQTRVAEMDFHAAFAEIRRGYVLLSEILGRPPRCAAAPAWRVAPSSLRALDRFPFDYRSDCRGRSVFRPRAEGEPLRHVQVPTTLPTYDERIGPQCPPERYNAKLLEEIRPDRLNVLTIHAEAEGIGCRPLFRDFLDQAKKRGLAFMPLGNLLAEAGTVPEAGVRKAEIPGREGWVAVQTFEEGTIDSNV